MITLYHLGATASHRTAWLLEELQLAYHIAPSALESTAHPFVNSCIVAIKDEDNIVSGSVAIAEYLLNKYDRKGLRPPITSATYTAHQQWLTHTESFLIPLLQKLLTGEKLAHTRVPFFARSILKKAVNTTFVQHTEEQLKEQCAIIENILGLHRWICDSHFSLADIQLSYFLETCLTKGLITKETHPNIDYFLEAIQSRLAYKAAQDKLSAIQSPPVIEEIVEITDE